MADTTTISISKQLKRRLDALSAQRAKNDRIEKPYAAGVYLSMLIKEEEDRINAPVKLHQ